MASEPDDYQTISDNCPGYMVLISEGIICTRCSGEKRHKANDCPKPATAADLAADDVPGADYEGDGMEHADSEMESLSDTDSVSSGSTGRSDSSEMQMTESRQSDQGGNHPQDTHLPRRGFARPDASHTSSHPDRASLEPPNLRAGCEPTQARRTFSKASGRVSDEATRNLQMQSSNERDVMYGPNSLALYETYPEPRSSITTPNGLPSNKKRSSSKTGGDKSKKGNHSHHHPLQHDVSYEANRGRLTPKSLADTTGKFDYSNTTCPSSFGFGQLPSEAMG